MAVCELVSCGQHHDTVLSDSVECFVNLLIVLLFVFRLDWPVRTLSFSHDGKMLASASEDHFIDIAEVETGQCLLQSSDHDRAQS